MTDLTPITGGQAIAVPDTQRNARTALGLWLASYRSENTKRAYRREIEAFAAFTGQEDVPGVVAAFLALEDSRAHAFADAWRTAKLAKGLSPAAINRSMAALNSFVASARRHGFTMLRLEAKGERSQSYRDTRGPGIEGVQAMLARARRQDRRKAARDEAIVRLAFGLAQSLATGAFDIDMPAACDFSIGMGLRSPREATAQDSRPMVFGSLVRSDQFGSRSLFGRNFPVQAEFALKGRTHHAVADRNYRCPAFTPHRHAGRARSCRCPHR
jgi:integrase/recombinase XerC